MKYIILAIMIFSCAFAYGAGEGIYNNSVVVVDLVRPSWESTEVVQDGTYIDKIDGKEYPKWIEVPITVYADYLEIDVPFDLYGENVYYNDRDITRSYRQNLALEGVEVMALITYKVEDQKTVDKMKGNMGWDWEKIKKNDKYKLKYKIKKEEHLATYTKIGELEVKALYKGIDKDESVKFCQWEEC